MHITAEEFTAEMAQVGYEGYCAFTDNKSLVSGAQLPPWSELRPAIQDAWGASAEAMTQYLATT